MWLVGPGRHRLQHRAIYSGRSICECGLSVHDSHKLKAQSYLHATYLSGSISKSGMSVHDSHRLMAKLSPCYLFWWKYLCKWLVGPGRHRLQHRATYSGGSICESGLPVNDSYRLKAQSYLHAIYLSGSICENGLLVRESHRLKAGGSIDESGLSVYDSHRLQAQMIRPYRYQPVSSL